MEKVTGDIWEFEGTHSIVVGTNVGWDERADPPMRNNMGAGLAMQARDRFPRLAWWYGLTCCRWALEQSDMQSWMPPQKYRDPKSSAVLILVPVKPLMVSDPSKSWDQKADLEWVRKGFGWLQKHTSGPVALPLIGSGNGKLDPLVVEEVAQEILGDDRRFLLVVCGQPGR